MAPGHHVLIIDDDAGVREALSAALHDAYAVYTAASGDEACGLLARQPMDAIIVDVVLREEDGLTLIRRLRDHSEAPVLVITGYGSEEVAVRALREGARDYLKKPINVLAVRAAVANLLARTMEIRDPVELAYHRMVATPEELRSVAELARRVGLTERTFRRRFQQMFGTKPRDRLEALRLHLACLLLDQTSLGAGEVATRVGYSGLEAFDRAFKRTFHLSPLEYRTRSRSGAFGRNS